MLKYITMSNTPVNSSNTLYSIYTIFLIINLTYALPGYGEFWCAEGSTDC